jgi:hypothetical protein
MNPEIEARIRERAYQIWEEEGRPEGRDFDHWMRAVESVRFEDGSSGDAPDVNGSAENSPVAAKPKRAAAKPGSPAKLEAASAEEPSAKPKRAPRAKKA